MADRDGDKESARNPDLGRDVSFSSILNRFQNQVARFTMPPPDDNAYDDETRNDFLGQVPLYNAFRRQMRLLIIQNPGYAHLRDFWNVLYRGFIGEEQETHSGRAIAMEPQMEPQRQPTALHTGRQPIFGLKAIRYYGGRESRRAARMTMPSAHHRLYAGITFNLRNSNP